jgi:hypothetical protein
MEAGQTRRPAQILEAPIPNRSRTSSQKRQKELARMEKQRDKAAKRAQRKIERLNAPPSDPLQESDELSAPADDSETPPE